MSQNRPGRGGGGGGSGGGTDHSGAIWVLGIALVLAVMATSPYWQVVGLSALSGQLPGETYPAGLARMFPGVGMPTKAGTSAGLWLTLGAVVLVVVLAAIAQISQGAGALALILLIGIWVLFLLGHSKGISGVFSSLQAKQQ